MNIYNRIALLISRIDRKLPAGWGIWPKRLVSWAVAIVLVYIYIVAPELAPLPSTNEISGEHAAMCEGPHDFIPAANVARVDLRYLEYGQRMQNTLYFLGTAQWDATSLEELVDAAIANWATEMGSTVAIAVALDSVKAQDMEVDEGVAVEKIPVSATTGARNNEPMPSGVTVATKFSTLLSGRSHRGRVYNVGLTDDMVNGNALAGVVAGDISSNWSSFVTAIISATDNATTHVVVSYCHNKVWRTVAEITPIIGYSTDIYIDSQRRRLTNRGS